MQRGLTMPSVGKYCCKNEIKTELDCAQSSRKRQRTEGTTEEVDGRSQPQVRLSRLPSGLLATACLLRDGKCCLLHSVQSVLFHEVLCATYRASK